MTNKEFFQKVDGARGVTEEILDHNIVIRLVDNAGHTLSEHFELTHLSYMFSPFYKNSDDTRGALVLEIKVT